MPLQSMDSYEKGMKNFLKIKMLQQILIFYVSVYILPETWGCFLQLNVYHQEIG